MSKTIVNFFAVVAITCAAGIAQADTPAESALDAMGLSGMDVLSDSEALSVRGKGFPGNGKRPHKLGVMAYGKSWANIKTRHGEAGTEDGYKAIGNYSAGGKHFSEAGKEIVKMEIVEIDGSIKKHTTTEAVRVFAGGFADAMRL